MTTKSLVTVVFTFLFCTGLTRSSVGDSFGSGANTFDIEFVTIGDPGNPGDTEVMSCCGELIGTSGYGSVPYAYRMAKFEISEQMVDKANALGGLGITKTIRGPDKPATEVSWNEAARFVNWLNTSTGGTPAYKFAVQPGEVGYSANANILLWDPIDPGYNPNNLYRNSLARYFLPSENEWYKAAYYDPANGVYHDYPTGSDSTPTAVPSGTAAGTAVHMGQTGPADVTLAGGLSAYGTMGQGGNVSEWEETDYDLLNGPSSPAGSVGGSVRGIRGGSWNDGDATGDILRASARFNDGPTDEKIRFGFRVASISPVPEPPSVILLAFLCGPFVNTRCFFRRPMAASAS